MTSLEALQDEDGLVSVSELRVDPMNKRNLFLKSSGQQVYLEPRIFGVADIILAREHLSEMAKLRVNLESRGLKSARIFGATFKHALVKLDSLKLGIVSKSMYKVLDEQKYTSYGCCATLVAHLQKKIEHVQIEVWQYTPDDVLTSYLHGVIQGPSGTFTHFDGATIYHTPDEQQSIFEHVVKEKGRGYLKQFRLDGEIKVQDVTALAGAFLPNEQLAIECFEISNESEA